MGSECFTDDNFCEILKFEKRFVLSLDFGSNGEQLGPQKFFTQIEFWSENVILMTLNRVGSLEGLEIDVLKQFQHDYPQINFIAAGGVRNNGDLVQLEKVELNTFY